VIVIHCRFVIDPKDRDAWTESAQRMATLSRAEEGNIAYDFSFDVIDPNVAYVYEAWTTQELLDRHIAAPHHVARAEELKAWNIDYQQIFFYGVAWERDVRAELLARDAAH
jgi:quinol monooxygenase YgiN